MVEGLPRRARLPWFTRGGGLQRWRGGELLRLPHFPVLSLPLQLRNLITDSSRHKLLVFAGPCIEETGELVLQTGAFSLRDFIQVFADKEVRLPTLPGAGRGSWLALGGGSWGVQRAGLAGSGAESGAGGEGLLGEGSQRGGGDGPLCTSAFTSWMRPSSTSAERLPGPGAG